MCMCDLKALYQSCMGTAPQISVTGIQEWIQLYTAKTSEPMCKLYLRPSLSKQSGRTNSIVAFTYMLERNFPH